MTKIIRILGILLILGAVVFGVAVIVEKNKGDSEDNAMPPVTVVTQDPSQSQPAQTPPAAGTDNTQNPSAVPVPAQPSAEPVGTLPAPAPNPVPGPEPVDTPPPTPVLTTPAPFKSATGLKVTLASHWYPQEEVREGKTYIVFYNSGNAVVSSIEAFYNPVETLDSIEQQLKASPSVLGFKRVVVDGVPALQYQTSKGTMLVLTRNGTVFYVSGALATDYSRMDF